jgi:hypothetical protein
VKSFAVEKVVFICSLLLIAALTACVQCEDCDFVEQEFRYVNQTAYNVELDVRLPDTVTVPPSGEINQGDSVVVAVQFGFEYSEFWWERMGEFSIRFNGAMPRCLVYKGIITDSLNDPRSRSAYEDQGQSSVSIYRVTDARYALAEACP